MLSDDILIELLDTDILKWFSGSFFQTPTQILESVYIPGHNNKGMSKVNIMAIK